MRAFTFVEIMISTVVLGLIIAGIFMLLLISDKTYHTDVALLDLQQFTRRALDEMVEELRAADKDSITISGGVDIVFTGTLGTGIHYYRDVPPNEDRLIREYPAGTFQTMASYINTLSFCWCHGANCSLCDNDPSGSELIQIQLRSTKTVRGRVINFPISGPMKGQVKLRNE